MKRSQRLIAIAVLVILSIPLAILLGDVYGGVTGLRSFEDQTLDFRQRTTATSFQVGMGERESEVVLVLFDELSFLESPWISPFPRAHLAALIDAAAAAGAKTIGVDVYLDLEFDQLNAIDGGDDLLRDAIERAGNVVLVSPTIRTDSGFISAPPHPRFASVAAHVGTAELPASFETFRDGTLAVRSGERLAPSFSLAMYAHSRGLDVDSILDAAWRRGRLELPGLPQQFGAIPEEWRSGSGESAEAIVPFRIRYLGPPSGTMDTDPPGTFTSIGSSNAELLAMLSPETFQDKIVLLGTGFHAEDRFRTPFYGFATPPDESGEPARPYAWMYGVEIHANALQNILDGDYVRPLGWGWHLLLLFAVALVSGGPVFRQGAGWGAVLAIGSVLGTWVVAFWGWWGSVTVPGLELAGFGPGGVWVPIVTPTLAAGLSYVGSVTYVAVVEGKEKRFIKGAFGKYLSPDVVAEIFKDPSSLTLGGEKRPLTLLFSDLAGFTTMSEETDAQDLIALLNEYLDDMTQVVFDEQGYLDKYIGDAIMAFWNAPKDVPQHADHGIRAAIFMQRRMDDFNRRWREQHPEHEELKVRIGVHTGEVIVGNVGGKDRFDYSAIGDAVNLAARLEPANKTYDTLNMVSEISLDAAEDEYRVRELDVIAVKGKEKPVKVYELLELAGVELAPDKEEALARFEQGMEAYRQHRWDDAKHCFEAAVAACPSDGPSRVYVDRCAANIADPPPADWDFVVRRTEK